MDSFLREKQDSSEKPKEIVYKDGIKRYASYNIIGELAMDIRDNEIYSINTITMTLTTNIVDDNKNKWFIHLIAEQDQHFDSIVKVMMPHNPTYLDVVPSEVFVPRPFKASTEETAKTRQQRKILEELQLATHEVNEKIRYQESLLEKYWKRELPRTPINEFPLSPIPAIAYYSSSSESHISPQPTTSKRVRVIESESPTSPPRKRIMEAPSAPPKSNRQILEYNQCEPCVQLFRNEKKKLVFDEENLVIWPIHKQRGFTFTDDVNSALVYTKSIFANATLVQVKTIFAKLARIPLAFVSNLRTVCPICYRAEADKEHIRIHGGSTN